MDRLTNPSQTSSSASPRGGDFRDVVSGGVLLATAIAYGIGSLAIPPQPGEPGPGFLPMTLAGLLGALALSILVGGLRGAGRLDSALTDEPSDATREESRGPWLAALATILYATLFQPLGFALSTVAYSAVLTALFTDERKLRLGVPVLATAALYVFFSAILGVRLPSGLFG